jgi:hypothetical protein
MYSIFPPPLVEVNENIKVLFGRLVCWLVVGLLVGWSVGQLVSLLVGWSGLSHVYPTHLLTKRSYGMKLR